jgi:hypothetical protein
MGNKDKKDKHEESNYMGRFAINSYLIGNNIFSQHDF